MCSKSSLRYLGLALLMAASAMAISASVVQAKYLLLQKQKSVNDIPLTLALVGSGSLEAENGLKIECKTGTGFAWATLGGSKEKVSTEASIILRGCVWIGSEKTCVINDGGEGGEGMIKVKGSGEVIMSGSSYLATMSSFLVPLATIFTEGTFCTIPEQEEIYGAAHGLIENALADTTTKSLKLLNLSLTLGNSKVKSLSATLSAVHFSIPTFTLGIHLESLSGCTPIC
jgi:hypothetical protein